MTRLYLYRMSSDTGNAPCAYDKEGNTLPVLSLACCKGGGVRANGGIIRSGMRRNIGRECCDEDNVWISALFKGKLLYIAKVDKIVRMKEYFSKPEYENRLDQIYDVCINDAEGREESSLPDYEASLIRNDWNLGFHGTDEKKQHICDSIGLFVPISKEFIYLGEEFGSIDLPEDVIKKYPARRGYRSYQGDKAQKYIDAILQCVYQKHDAGSTYVAKNPANRLQIR